MLYQILKIIKMSPIMNIKSTTMHSMIVDETHRVVVWVFKVHVRLQSLLQAKKIRLSLRYREAHFEFDVRLYKTFPPFEILR